MTITVWVHCVYYNMGTLCLLQYGCIVSACYDGTVKVWSHKGTEITTLHGHGKGVNACDIYVKVKDKGREHVVVDVIVFSAPDHWFTREYCTVGVYIGPRTKQWCVQMVKLRNSSCPTN